MASWRNGLQLQQVGCAVLHALLTSAVLLLVYILCLLSQTLLQASTVSNPDKATYLLDKAEKTGQRPVKDMKALHKRLMQANAVCSSCDQSAPHHQPMQANK